MMCRCFFLLCVLVVLTRAEQGRDTAAKRTRVRRAAKLNAHLKFTSILSKPFMMHTQPGSPGPYEGFIPDLIEELASALGFTYTIQLVKDGRYGICSTDEATNKTTCTGMIGEVYRGEADVAAAPITVTKSREDHVSFIWAFHQVGLTVLIRKGALGEGAWPINFDVFRPLKAEVYGMIFLAAAVVGLVLWLMNRFNPYEWGGSPQVDENEKAGADSFNLPGSMWFVLTSLQWQGFERAPRSLASKTLTVFWFIFVTITLITYTGSLMNHMFWASNVEAADPEMPPFRDMAGLVRSGKYDYGCIRGGSTYNLLMKLAEGEMYEAMRTYWKTPRGQNQFVKSTHEGVERVRKHPHYALIMETNMAHWLVNQRPCDLTTIGGINQPKSYAFAVQRNSKYRDQLHMATLELLEVGEINRLTQKWWVDKGECWNVTKARDNADARRLEYLQSKPKRVGLDNFWGPLVLMLAGVILSFLIALGEFLFNRHRKGGYPTGGGSQLTGAIDS